MLLQGEATVSYAMFVWDEYHEFFRCRPSMTAHTAPCGTLTPLLLREGRVGRDLHPHVDARIAGGRARFSGRAFEREIEEASAVYEQRGLAVVYRHHPPVEGWGRTLRVVGRGPADFSGVVRTGEGSPIAVAFDCKVITGEASYAHAERDRHQIESLLRFRDAGGFAFLLLRCRALERLWLLDDLDALQRRERVPVRSWEGGTLCHCLPVLAPAPLADVARGRSPYWDYLRLLPLLSKNGRSSSQVRLSEATTVREVVR